MFLLPATGWLGRPSNSEHSLETFSKKNLNPKNQEAS